MSLIDLYHTFIIALLILVNYRLATIIRDGRKRDKTPTDFPP
jgi:hypothetical protein